jgi:bifunctional non-homologous end joining protein LigD
MAKPDIELTHPDRVYFPDAGVTKRDYRDYLVGVADWILPHVRRRPLSLVRCPDDIEAGCFFQKHHAEGMPAGFKSVDIAEKSGETAPYIYIEDEAGLTSCAQFGALELHPWGSRIDDLEHPERLIFDLDPGEGFDFADLKDAAREIRALLEEAGLNPFVMLTGGKGIHVIAPIRAGASWDDARDFARGLAKGLEANDPDRYVAEASKEKRKARIFVDWLRNQRGQTSIAPYALRARPGAPAATPIRWDELSKARSGHDYDIHSLPRRLARIKEDPWKDYFQSAAALSPNAVKQAREQGGD